LHPPLPCPLISKKKLKKKNLTTSLPLNNKKKIKTIDLPPPSTVKNSLQKLKIL
jgi:hypothetical protein